MTLLAPLFLLGLAGIALPVWLHRLKTQSPEREAFSSTMLLEASEQRVHVRRQLRYWLLLALRVLLLVLLALAFAKPVLERQPGALSGSAPTLHLIVVDTSLSMGQGDRMERARAAADDIIAAARAGDRMQLVTAGSGLAITAGPTAERAIVGNAVAGLEAGYERVDLGVLIAGLGALADPELAPDELIRVHLISDLQASGLPTRFADLVPAPINGRAVALTLHPVADQPAANWAIEFARQTADGFDVGVRSFAADPANRTVTLSVNGERVASQSTEVAPAGQSLVSFPPATLTSGDNRLVVQLTPADALPADDMRFVVVDNAPPAAVLLLTRDVDSLPVTYLTTALATVPRGYAAEPVHVADLDTRILSRYSWVVIDDLGIVNERLGAALGDYVKNGGSLLATAGEAALGRRTLPVTQHALPATTPAVTELRSVTRIEASHPALSGTRGWRSINVAQTLPLVTTEQDRVLVGLSDGQALLLERSIGAGRVLLLTSRLDSSWSDLAIQPVFVNFIAEAARYLGGGQSLERQRTAGSSLTLNQTAGVSGQVIDPSGRTVLGLADTRRAAEVRLSQTGFYEVYTPGTDALVAVNPDPRESDLAPMTQAARTDWQNLLVQPGASGPATDAEPVAPLPMQLWQGVLVLLVLTVLVESMLGNGYLSQRRGAT